ncbi:flagellar basal body P-ring protein FlgI [Desulfoluna butyratoxydans]|uniref:Flagellar P-ring protein n=1 Tax=Desulfoluna butyratoxydans TaxID=231438 RepID=A0A4U8YR60_9BACT|nr:flagellar basal body P-ring protein FlgI [Desulfoluna butyratoxydans]VFQ46361.1 flagellar p-ring protein [Desulfoluna butyratoxydans]
MKKHLLNIPVILTALLLLAAPLPTRAERLKDIASIQGAAPIQLTGYGIVVGLAGTGDKKGADFTQESLANMMTRMGVTVDKDSLKLSNAAAVMVSASMPAFARKGTRLDITVSSIGNAKSLGGGTLLPTALRTVNGETRALAQGAIAIGGAGTAKAKKNHLLVGRISNGASVERERDTGFSRKHRMILNLNNPDFTTCSRVALKINNTFGKHTAQTLDSGAVQLTMPSYMQGRVTEFIAKIENLTVTPDTPARIVVNEKTGTVIIGENVRIGTVALAHGNLTLTVTETKNVSQPNALSGGDTVVTKEKNTDMTEDEAQVMLMPKGTTIQELVNALNAIGVSPRDMISIFQSIKAAGALQADLVII